MGNSRASPCAVSPRTPSWGLTFLGIGMPLVIYGALFCIFLFLAMFRIAYKNWFDTGGVYGRWRARPVPPDQIAAATQALAFIGKRLAEAS